MIEPSSEMSPPEVTTWKVNRIREIGEEIAVLLTEQNSLIASLSEANDLSPGGALGVMHTAIRNGARALETQGARLEWVLTATGRTKRTIYRWMDEKGFPKPQKVRGVAYWDVDAVKKWWAENEAEVGRWPT